MSSQPVLVSVAMATYNGERFLVEQLDSILGQTHRELELLVTDDASTDGTMAILEEYRRRDPRIRVFRNETNRGVNATFEHSFRQCSGAFVAIADQDDTWELNKIEILFQAIKEEEAVYSNSELVDESGRPIGTLFSSLMKLQSYYSAAPFLMGNCIPGHTILIRRAFLLSLLPIPGPLMFDRWISFCSAGNKGIRYVDQPLVKYRQHGANTIGTGHYKKKKKKKTRAEKFAIKQRELLALNTGVISDRETKDLLRDMIALFHRRPSLKRSLFFFRNIDRLLVIKNKPRYRKILYCLKMFFKPNY